MDGSLSTRGLIFVETPIECFYVKLASNFFLLYFRLKNVTNDLMRALVLASLIL